MKKWIKRILAALLILVLVCVLAFCGLYLGRFKTLASIRKVSAYEDGYNLYRMDIKYDYSLDDIIASGITWLLCRSKNRISRMEGGFMLAMYLVYLIYVIVR